MRKSLFLIAALVGMLPLSSQAQKKTEIPLQTGANVAIASTEYGKVRGYIHNGIYTYKGIPYGKAERFMAVTKPDSWTGVRSSMTYGPGCPIDPTTQVNDETEFPFHHDWGYMNEHCQVLNVWSGGINDGKKRPVMVWLHGGGFSAGSSQELPSYDGESLARKGDVVLVSVNHRLNLLGFLDLGAYGDKYKNAANAGLGDLVMALKWVQNNIAQFGGDPNNVTIFGQSGGGGKVTSLMNAPAAKGLFHKAIVQSGSYITSFTDPAIARRVSAAMLEELKLQPGQVDSLQKVSYERLSTASRRAMRKVAEAMRAEGKQPTGLGWGPILDGSLLPYQPGEPAAIELSKNIPLLVGSTKNEFAPFNPATRNVTMDGALETIKKRYPERADAYLAAAKKAYPETTKPSDYLDFDIGFRIGAIRQGSQKASTGTAPVYMYLFNWQSPVLDGIFKSMHCMELPFVFDNIARCEEMTGGRKEAHVLADKMSRAWIQFARTGDPNHKGLPTWPKYTAENGSTMLFDNSCVVKSHHDKELLEAASGKPVL